MTRVGMAGKVWAVLTQSPPLSLAHQGLEIELPGTLGYTTCFTFASQHGLGLGTRTGPWTRKKAGRRARSASGVSALLVEAGDAQRLPPRTHLRVGWILSGNPG